MAKSIRELLSLPEYANIVNLKPKIGGGEDKGDKDVIILDDVPEKRPLSKRQRQIEALKDRFVKHALVSPPKPVKGEHVKLKIKRKEEDSQGIEHLVENEVDYVRNPLGEDDLATDGLTPQNISPQANQPGSRFTGLKQTLLARIHTARKKAHEVRVKEAELYGREDYYGRDEEDGEEADNEDDDEEQINDSEEDSDAEEEEDEEVEYLLNSSNRKKKKSAFVEDEAEDEDDASDDDEGEDESDSDDEKSDVGDKCTEENNKKETISIDDSQESGLSASANFSPKKTSDGLNSVNQSEDDSMSMEFGESECEIRHQNPVITPVAVAADNYPMNPPADFWIPAKLNASRPCDELSPLIPRIQKPAISSIQNEKILNPTIPDSLANVISEAETKFDDLVDLCSGKLVSRSESQAEIEDDDEEFGNFDFGEDELCDVNAADTDKEGNIECAKTPTPAACTGKNATNGITPKLIRPRPSITRRSMQFDIELEADLADNNEEAPENSNATSNFHKEKTDNPFSKSEHVENDDDEEEVGVVRKSFGKKKRLQFSDDEDEDDQRKDPLSEDEQSEADDVELEESQHEEIVQEAPKANPFYNKFGLLKRKFVDNEAELSGSDEGSEDEDESGLNYYEDDEGDDEELDESEIRNQVGRAHLKQMLDDDDREIRRLQNDYLENGDLTGQQRSIRLGEKIDFSGLNDDAHMGDSDNEEQAEETPEEIARKAEWIKQRKWIAENSHLLEADVDESQSLFNSCKIGAKTMRRIESFIETSTSESTDLLIRETSTKRKSFLEEIIKVRKSIGKSLPTTHGVSNNEPTSFSEGFGAIVRDTNTNSNMEESSKSMTEPMFPIFGLGGTLSRTKTNKANTISLPSKKGSFLSRGGTMLTKLAETAKTGDTVSNVKNNSRNFVFSHVTPPNPEKTDGSTSRVKRGLPGGNCKTQAKKIKVDRSFHSLDETSKQSSVFKFL